MYMCVCVCKSYNIWIIKQSQIINIINKVIYISVYVGHNCVL